MVLFVFHVQEIQSEDWVHITAGTDFLCDVCVYVVHNVGVVCE